MSDSVSPAPTLINLTPHIVHIRTRIPDGGEIAVQPTLPAARLSVTSMPCGTLRYDADGAVIALCKQVLGEVRNLPAPVPGTMLVVSRMVAEACPDRRDLLFPGTLIRDGQGRVVGCEDLCVAWAPNHSLPEASMEIPTPGILTVHVAVAMVPPGHEEKTDHNRTVMISQMGCEETADVWHLNQSDVWGEEWCLLLRAVAEGTRWRWHHLKGPNPGPLTPTLWRRLSERLTAEVRHKVGLL